MLGRNWPSVWVKMASSWVCVFVYVVTIFIPRCLPGQDFSTLARPRKTHRSDHEMDVDGTTEPFAGPSSPLAKQIVLDSPNKKLKGSVQSVSEEFQPTERSPTPQRHNKGSRGDLDMMQSREDVRGSKSHLKSKEDLRGSRVSIRGLEKKM